MAAATANSWPATVARRSPAAEASGSVAAAAAAAAAGPNNKARGHPLSYWLCFISLVSRLSSPLPSVVVVWRNIRRCAFNWIASRRQFVRSSVRKQFASSTNQTSGQADRRTGGRADVKLSASLFAASVGLLLVGQQLLRANSHRLAGEQKMLLRINELPRGRQRQDARGRACPVRSAAAAAAAGDGDI